jgi:hypothetical protein
MIRVLSYTQVICNRAGRLVEVERSGAGTEEDLICLARFSGSAGELWALSAGRSTGAHHQGLPGTQASTELGSSYSGMIATASISTSAPGRACPAVETTVMAVR